MLRTRYNSQDIGTEADLDCSSSKPRIRPKTLAM